ncbi:MAG: MarR family winged helix-turn-helix transcriptional regulator [Eubacteriaceae bacterium]
MFKDKSLGYILHKAAMFSKCNFSNLLSNEGLTPSQFRVIKDIYICSKEQSNSLLTPACIAKRLHKDRPTISGIIERLESQGWIERIKNPEDKRSCIIILSQKAKSQIPKLEKLSIENDNDLVEGFSEEEIALFRKFLLKVIYNLSKK